MGFLNRLFGNEPAFEDRVWMTEELKFDDVVQRARDGNSLIVYHFAETGQRMRSRLDEKDVDYQRLRRPSSEAIERLQGTHVLDADELPDEVKRGQARRTGRGGNAPCKVHLVEHYPTPLRDDQVLNLHSILAPESSFVCYVGLDEAWIQRMLGSSTRELLERLGMSDDEPLMHSMIGGALRRTQEQIDKKRRNLENYARSSAEWMQLNMSE